MKGTMWLSGPTTAWLPLATVGVWALAESGGLATDVGRHDPHAWIAIATAVVILLSAFVSSIAGFAFSAIAGGAFAYLDIDAVHAVRTLTLCSIATQTYAVWKIRDAIRWAPLLPMIGAGAVTIPVGVWLLLHVDASVYAVGLGVFVAVYGGYTLMRGSMPIIAGSVWRDMVAGGLGGLTGGLASFPGPFVTIWCSMQGLDKLRQRAIYQPYILAMQIVTIVCLQCAAPVGKAALADVGFVPFALLGAIGGLALFKRMTTTQFQLTVSALLSVSGVGLLARSL